MTFKLITAVFTASIALSTSDAFAGLVKLQNENVPIKGNCYVGFSNSKTKAFSQFKVIPEAIFSKDKSFSQGIIKAGSYDEVYLSGPNCIDNLSPTCNTKTIQVPEVNSDDLLMMMHIVEDKNEKTGVKCTIMNEEKFVKGENK